MSQSNFTQTSLSKKCGSIAQTTLSGYIRGLHFPTDEKIKILAEALGVEYEWLKDGEKVKDSSVGETSTEPSVGEETPPLTEDKASAVDAIQPHSLFSSRLKQVMEEKGLSQVELHRACLPLCGDRISISRNAIWTYVRGDRHPTDEKMKILAEALGVEYEWLRDEKEDTPPVVEETSTEPSVGEETPTQPSVEDNATEPSVEEKVIEPRVASTEPRETSTEPDVEETSTEPIMITIILQYGADDMDITDLKERCRSAWRAQFGDGAIRSLAVYIKPEDHKAYWVVNEGQSGAVEI